VYNVFYAGDIVMVYGIVEIKEGVQIIEEFKKSDSKENALASFCDESNFEISNYYAFEADNIDKSKIWGWDFDSNTIVEMVDSVGEIVPASSTLITEEIVKDEILQAMEFGKSLIADLGAKCVTRGYSEVQVQQCFSDSGNLINLLSTGALNTSLDYLSSLSPSSVFLQEDIDFITSKIQNYVA